MPGEDVMSSLVTYSRSGPISRIVMDDGKVNVMSISMLEELHAAFDAAEHDKAIVVLTGRDHNFSAGFDLKVFASGNAHDIRKMVRAGADFVLRVLSFPTPVLVACTGHGIAMGAFPLLAADVRIAVEGPYKIGLNEVAIGLNLPEFAVELARQRLTPAYLNRGLLTGETLSPTEAATAGYIDWVVPSGELATVVDGAVDKLSKISLDAHAAAKALVRGTAIATIRAAIDRDMPLEDTDQSWSPIPRSSQDRV
jgi:enoyl-CoA hydratase